MQITVGVKGLIFYIVSLISAIGHGVCNAFIDDTRNIALMNVKYVDSDSNDVYVRLKIRLYKDQFPKTVSNFKAFCEGVKVRVGGEERMLGYAGIPFHRIIDEFVAQGGDVVKKNGTGSASSFPEKNFGSFEDEPDQMRERRSEYPARLHDRVGMVAMANRGENTNGSQFYIVLSKNNCQHLDGVHTVFAEVIEGMDELQKVVSDYTQCEKRRANSGSLPIIESVTLEEDTLSAEDYKEAL
ncbi:uncharacterized protein NEMAJ01_2063 [Nematocida major]|uniref:uncharacterized protein n=1 Tax=Nematocida major TaxID=1912982 RepID=UPI002007F073|nr:uncharacterized protein NEMAJ01_2063 [Nematocida major]KAH9387167.1 hypothetical protein NEMAJ01_2063 [Nematocida major]